jgi:ribosomal protein L33
LGETSGTQGQSEVCGWPCDCWVCAGADAGTGCRTLLVKLLSTAGTGFFYTTKRPRVALYKLAFRKFDPVGMRCTRTRALLCPPRLTHRVL